MARTWRYLRPRSAGVWSLKTLSIGTFLVAVLLFNRVLWPSQPEQNSFSPLLTKYVDHGQGAGGRWYIPDSWVAETNGFDQPERPAANASVLDAAEYALDIVLRQGLFLNNTRIPRVIHQTWRTFDTRDWPVILRSSVEAWLRTAKGDRDAEEPEMAWFLWDDNGIDALVERFENQMYSKFHLLPYPVEKADVFRVTVLKWFGGLYADVDTTPLKHPYTWITHDDTLPWHDIASETTLTLHQPPASPFSAPANAPASYRVFFEESSTHLDLSKPSVSALFGLEADNPPAPDPTYWRMGYTYSVQLTNWALAMSPHHPVADQFLNTLVANITQNQKNLASIDPLDITGPPALTKAVIHASQSHDRFSWDSLSGRNDDSIGGRSKIVAGDTLILPITAFSPGRGWFQRMGSQSITHKNARLYHAAAGSWRKADLKVEYGKLCRTLFGLCRDWKKIPDVKPVL